MDNKNTLLFKGLSKGKNNWVQGGIVFIGEQCYIVQVSESSLPYTQIFYNDVRYSSYVGLEEVEPNTICRCTGKRDINGNLVWEGDILKGFTYPFLSVGNYNYFAEICWFEEELEFGLCTHKNPKAKINGISEGIVNSFEDDYWEDSDWEVIGNVFDNKELLGVT